MQGTTDAAHAYFPKTAHWPKLQRCLFCEKRRRRSGWGRRGRVISTPHRQTAITLIDEAVIAGARRAKACAELEISARTLRRWTKDGQIYGDQRPLVPRLEPANKLSAEATSRGPCSSAGHLQFRGVRQPATQSSWGQIVPKQADQGRYLASESSFYRIVRAEEQQHHRGRARPPVRRKPPTSYKASGPCEVWTRDITWMPGPVAGMFFYLYLIVDIFSRKIVGWEVHERESAELAAILIRQMVMAEGCIARPLVLHAENGSPMAAL
jgi:putative transposase